MKIISLGWGTQSFALAAMAALGEIEPVDFAIHADTTHERMATYQFAERWTGWLETRGVKVVTVKNTSTNIRIGKIDIPAFTVGDGILGMIRRQCTGDWKIAPMRREIQNLRDGEPVEQWLGITLDEVQRMRKSDVKYITHRWPLIERKMSRWDCIRWLDEHGLEVPTRSACVFCPFHSRAEWRDIRDNAPEDWGKAVEVDKMIRKSRPPYDLFVCNQRKPLEECDFDTQEDAGQLSLWENECIGICGV